MKTRKHQDAEIQNIAQERLGFSKLRPGQQEAIAAILSGRDTLVVRPTGSGKSAIYQIAGLMLEGATVIVSPLIALQKDQSRFHRVAGLRRCDRRQLHPADARDARDLGPGQARPGRIHFPCARATSETRDDRAPPAVSKSLCSSSTRHIASVPGATIFAPINLSLAHTIEALGRPRVLALTATATRDVREEIIKHLQLRAPAVLVSGFDRPNIYLRVDHFKTQAEKRDALVHRTVWADKPGIIYTGTRKAAEEITRALKDEGVEALPYHGGMKGEERHEIQERFMSGGAQVIVATSAFGMGVDKPDVRFVYHHDPADSLDSYYQEIGRAGRDGERSEAILFFRPEDIGAQSYKTSDGGIDPVQLEKLAIRIASEDGQIDPEAIAEEVGLSRRKLTIALHRLEDAKADSADPVQAAQIATEDHERLSQARRERLEQMRAYADTADCRRELLLRYLGDEFDGPCGSCDRCGALDSVAVDPSVGTRREVL